MSDLPGKRFVRPDDVETQVFDWGAIKWYSEPNVTATDRFTMGVVILECGKGHARHNHPGCEEILYVISGKGDQMIELDGEEVWEPVQADDTVHIPADVYHSTINTGWEPLKLVAIYCPPGPEAFLKTLPGCQVIPPGRLPVRG